LKEDDDINKIYSERVKELVIGFDGNVKEGVIASTVNIASEYKKRPEDRMLPVYEFRNQDDPAKLDNVVLPVYGFVKGVKFQHKGETPGLGARIESEEIQARYKGKSIYDGDALASVIMQKGEGMDYSGDAHKVDGMSGATLTAKGVNNMLMDYFNSYRNYLNKNKQNSSPGL